MKKLLCSVALVGMLVMPGAVHAQVEIGPHVVLADDVDFGVGGMIAFPLESLHESLEGMASFDLYFPDGVDYWEIGGVIRYLIGIDNPDVVPFVAAGIGIGNISNSVVSGVGDTRVGLKVGGGVKFAQSSALSPWGDILLGVGDLPSFALRVGAAFRVGG